MLKSCERHTRTPGHTLLEAIVATAIFIVVAVALSGVWVVYGSALAKSGETVAANFLSRSVTEGLIANGWDWLKTLEGVTPLPEEDFTLERTVRGRTADIHYNVTYEAFFNTGVARASRQISPGLSQDVCRITVTVRWRSDTGSKVIPGTDYNNEVTYISYVYRKAMN